jgi:hypothetical protein
MLLKPENGPMTSFTYIAFVVALAVLGGLAGIVAHYWRAHATMMLRLGEPLDTLTREDYQWEKHVVGAEWDGAGFWAADSLRNLVYYIATGVAVGMGFMLWNQRGELVGAMCRAQFAAPSEPSPW